MFNKLVGNTQAKNTLKRLLAGRRLPNSLLFAGPEGVGKREFALETARALLCIDPTGDEACGVCKTCVRIGEFTIPAPTDSNKIGRAHV